MVEFKFTFSSESIKSGLDSGFSSKIYEHDFQPHTPKLRYYLIKLRFQTKVFNLIDFFNAESNRKFNKINACDFECVKHDI